jgi:hypothetical protein
VPPELDYAYWDLQYALQDDSCDAYMDVTTENYRAAAGVTGDNCEGAFTVDEYEVGYYGYSESGEITGDTATLNAYEEYLEGDGYVETYVTYTLVNVDGEWLFDSVATTTL